MREDPIREVSAEEINDGKEGVMPSTLNRWFKRQSKIRPTIERRTAMPAPPENGRKTTASRPTTSRRRPAQKPVQVTSRINWTLVFLAAFVAIVLVAGFLTDWGRRDSNEVQSANQSSNNDTVQIADTTTGPTGVTGDVGTTDNGTVEESNNDEASNNNGDGEKLHGSGTLPNPVSTWNQGSWEVSEFARLQDNPIVVSWINRLKNPAPELWKTFPNVPNKDVPAFRVVNGDEVPDGVEYGVANVPFCQQDSRCDFIVPAWHYRLITADYGFLNLTCQGEGEKGCLLLLINVMDQSYTWRDQMADNGFTVPGRYWNGDALEWGVWGLVSHASANMLNMPTQGLLHEVLNASGGANAGANCGHPEGCGSVDATVVIHAGDEVLAVLHTVVQR